MCLFESANVRLLLKLLNFDNFVYFLTKKYLICVISIEKYLKCYII